MLVRSRPLPGACPKPITFLSVHGDSNQPPLRTTPRPAGMWTLFITDICRPFVVKALRGDLRKLVYCLGHCNAYLGLCSSVNQYACGALGMVWAFCCFSPEGGDEGTALSLPSHGTVAVVPQAWQVGS